MGEGEQYLKVPLPSGEGFRVRAVPWGEGFRVRAVPRGEGFRVRAVPRGEGFRVRAVRSLAKEQLLDLGKGAFSVQSWGEISILQVWLTRN